MQIGLREIIEAAIAVFMLGGIWRDIRATQRTVVSLKAALMENQQVLLALATTHNINHPNAKVPTPKVFANGEAH